MTARTTRQVILARRPAGRPRAADFAIEETPLADPGEGELLIATRWLSIDPMLAILIAEKPLGGAFPPLPLGARIPGGAVSEILLSRHSDFAVGDMVEGRTGWSDHAVVQGGNIRRIDPSLQHESLGILGLSGLSAWAGLDIAGPLDGRRLIISGASGAVGATAGQIAKARGAQVTGITSGADKCLYLIEELGFDAALDRHAPEFMDLVAAKGPFDLYFENVGGKIFDAVLPALSPGATILLCGVMASYADPQSDAPSINHLLQAVMARSLRIIGFNNRDYVPRLAEFESEVVALLRAGRMREHYNVLDGLEGAITHAATLFSDGHPGKKIARIPA
jgi:NADPH-dependent curcumin reductase CurA